MSSCYHIRGNKMTCSSPRSAERTKSLHLKCSEHGTEDCNGCHFINYEVRSSNNLKNAGQPYFNE